MRDNAALNNLAKGLLKFLKVLQNHNLMAVAKPNNKTNNNKE